MSERGERPKRWPLILPGLAVVSVQLVTLDDVSLRKREFFTLRVLDQNDPETMAEPVERIEAVR